MCDSGTVVVVLGKTYNHLHGSSEWLSEWTFLDSPTCYLVQGVMDTEWKMNGHVTFLRGGGGGGRGGG